MTVDQEAVPSFDVPLTLESVRILYRTADDVLATWETKEHPTKIQLKRQRQLRHAINQIGDWLIQQGVRG